MDFGFGTGEFGSGTFGFADITREAVFRRSVPQRIQDEDNGDLEQTLYAGADALDVGRKKIDDFIDQIDPLYSTSGLEEALFLTVQSATEVKAARWRLTFDDSDLDALYQVFAQSVDPEGNAREDGWLVRVEPFSYPVVEVNAFEGYIEVASNNDFSTLVGVNEGLELRPPDLLVRIGDTVGVFVDRQDPPEFTRRAVYRHHLLRDLKVSSRLFDLVGEIYGFDVDVSPLYCIEGPTAQNLLQSYPSKVYNGGTVANPKYYTTVSPLFYQYDEIPADLIPADDPDADVSFSVSPTFAQEGSYSVDGVEYWSATLAQSVYDNISSISNWAIVDPDGNQYWLEDKDDPTRRVFFYAPDPLNTSSGWTLVNRLRLDCRPDWRPAPAYVVETQATEVLTEPGAVLDDLFDRIEQKIRYYVPIHIRLLVNNFRRSATATLAPIFNNVSAATIVEDETTDSGLYGATYDTTPADEHPTDENTQVPYATFTVT